MLQLYTTVSAIYGLPVGSEDASKVAACRASEVRSTLRQFVRDWSKEGQAVAWHRGTSVL